MIVKLLAATLLGAFALTSSTAATAAQGCLGCQKLATAEDSESASQGNPVVTVTLWRETSNFSENCGDGGSCETAKCSYNWKVYYTTTNAGSSLGMSFAVNGAIVVDDLAGSNGVSTELDSGTYGPKTCNRTEPIGYDIGTGGTAFVSLDIADGCTECKIP